MKIPKKGERVERGAQFIGECKKLLDVGCGDGVLAHFIKDRVVELHGIDIDKSELKKARKNGFKTAVVDTDNSKFPYKTNTFDYAVSFDVIEHVYDPRKMLYEMHRVLKKGGKIIIATPNIRFTNHLIELIFRGRFPKTSITKEPYDGGHLHFFTYQDIEDLLKKQKFKNIQHEIIINKPERGWKGKLGEMILGKYFMREFRSPGILTIAHK